MNLLQKLPIGLGLACLMMMSSCSKEDSQTPEPVKSERTDASMRGIPPILTPVAASIPATYGATGSNILPTGWQREATCSKDLALLPTGTSSLTYLFGNPGLPWEKPLPPIPGVPNPTILTVSTYAKGGWSVAQLPDNKRSGVEAKIKDLMPGKSYSIDLYLSSTISKVKQNNLKQAPTEILVSQRDLNGNKIYEVSSGLFQGSPYWLKASIIIQANNPEEILNFTASVAHEGEFGYAHVFVDHNSVKQYKAPELP